MRARTISTAAVAASLTLLTGLVATSADATTRELKACWAAPTTATLPLTVTVSGRQFGQRTLANGTCKAWDVPTGNYRLTANANALRTIFNAGPQGRAAVCGEQSAKGFNVIANVTQNGATRTVTLGENGGSIDLFVRKGRLTKANFRLACN